MIIRGLVFLVIFILGDAQVSQASCMGVYMEAQKDPRFEPKPWIPAGLLGAGIAYAIKGDPLGGVLITAGGILGGAHMQGSRSNQGRKEALFIHKAIDQTYIPDFKGKELKKLTKKVNKHLSESQLPKASVEQVAQVVNQADRNNVFCADESWIMGTDLVAIYVAREISSQAKMSLSISTQNTGAGQ